MKIAYFKYGVGNVSSYTLLSWKELYKKLQEPSSILPLPVGSKQWENKKKRSDYIVRGYLSGPRNDQNLKYGCLVIIDGDAGRYGVDLSTIEEVHRAMTGYIHIVTSTPTPGRWRLFVPVKKYHPAMTDDITVQLYNFLIERGISVAFAGESKTNSQPWFVRAVTEGEKYKIFGNVKGRQWKYTKLFNKKEQFIAKQPRAGSRLRIFVEELKKGTIHQAAKSYIGWQIRTTNLTLGQILEDVTVLIKEHCTDKHKIQRWNDYEREELENWFTQQTFLADRSDKDFLFVPPISDAVKYHEKKNFPYLDISIQQPAGIFGKLVRAIIDKQQAVYNPDLAFWLSLLTVDYLAGCGYASVLSNRCDPIYCFTSGNSSQGKTSTIQGAKSYIEEILNSEQFSADIANKRLITRAGSAEGVYDLVTGQLQHGCDILFIQDEFGSVVRSRSESQKASFQEMFLYLATISRHEAVEARLLATANKKLKEYAKRKDVYCCHFNYFTTTTDATLRDILSDTDFGSGFLQRFVGGVGRSPYFRTKVDVYGHVEPVIEFDYDVVERLGMILSYASSIIGKQRINAPLPVRIKKKAKKYHLDITHHCILLDDVRYNKMGEKMLPLARVRALLDNPDNPVITLDHIIWAHCVVLSSVQYFDWLMKKLQKIRPHRKEVFAEKVHNYMVDKGFTSKRQAVPLRKINIRKPAGTSLTLREILEYLRDDGKVMRIEIVGKHQTYYRWYAVGTFRNDTRGKS